MCECFKGNIMYSADGLSSLRKGRGRGRTQGLHIRYSAVLPPTVSPVNSSLAGWLGKKSVKKTDARLTTWLTRASARTHTHHTCWDHLPAGFQRKRARNLAWEFKDGASRKNKTGRFYNCRNKLTHLQAFRATTFGMAEREGRIACVSPLPPLFSLRQFALLEFVLVDLTCRP